MLTRADPWLRRPLGSGCGTSGCPLECQGRGTGWAQGGGVGPYCRPRGPHRAPVPAQVPRETGEWALLRRFEGDRGGRCQQRRLHVRPGERFTGVRAQTGVGGPLPRVDPSWEVGKGRPSRQLSPTPVTSDSGTNGESCATVDGPRPLVVQGDVLSAVRRAVRPVPVHPGGLARAGPLSAVAKILKSGRGMESTLSAEREWRWGGRSRNWVHRVAQFVAQMSRRVLGQLGSPGRLGPSRRRRLRVHVIVHAMRASPARRGVLLVGSLLVGVVLIG